MLAPQGLIRGLVQRALLVANGDNQNQDVAIRLKRYGDVAVESAWPTSHVLADEGAYFTATMEPGATALQHGILAAFSSIVGSIVIGNAASKTDQNGKRVYPHFIRLLVSVAPTSATQLLYATVIDDKDRTPTTISSGTGGSGPGTPATATAYLSRVNSTNMDLTPQSVSRVYLPLSTAGGVPPAIPTPGANARTIQGNVPLRAQIPVVLDEYVIQFGNTDAQSALLTAAPAGASRVVSHHPPIVIGPGEWMVLHLWAIGNITAGIAFSGLDVGLVER